MQFQSFFTIVSLALVSMVQGLAIAPRGAEDVWAPTILTPDTNTIWKIGTCQNVTWDTSNAPVNISNGSGVQLINANRTFLQFLAKGFNLRNGFVDVTVPKVTPGQFMITLFGDSGDTSPLFQIVA